MSDEILFRCHCLSDFASDPKKDKSKDYHKAVAELADLKSKTRKLTEGQEEKLKSLPLLIKSLEKYRDMHFFSLTAMKRMRRMVREKKYGIVDNLDNKYLQKGLLCEEDGVSLLSDVTGEMYFKNKIRLENDWLTGECDVQNMKAKKKIVTDIKISWSSESYDNTLTLNKTYGWQVGVGYGWLFESDINRIAYCLVNTPVELIRHEMGHTMYKHKPVGTSAQEFELTPEGTVIKTQFFRNHIVSDDGWVQHLDGTPEYLEKGYWDYLVHSELLDENYKFRPIPKKQRVKIFQFQRDESKIEFIKKKLIPARDEINRLMDKDELEIFNLDVDDCDV